MTTEIRHARARLSQVVMHYVTVGEGEPVVLLHGWPQTWREWRHVIPLLAGRHKVIAPDLRGLGDTSKPLDGYDSRTIAGDIAELVTEHLGIARFHLVGHDWGGPTAFALASTRPERVATLTIVDVTIPGIGPDISQGGKRWHHAFHTTADLPEILVQGREHAYLSWFYREFSWQPDAITAEDVDAYVRAYSQPGAMRAGFAYYRNIPKNIADNRALLEAGFKLPMPVLAVGGGRTEARGRGEEPQHSLREIAAHVEGMVVAESGHFVPEEQPQALGKRLLEFFGAHPIR
ncbi:MAG TPA: alpha/beta fold hydrolase [Burkholderiales bacterium]|nr:alpha/beta fold hydrolase [Burkholderiales bacterium]